MDPNSVFWAESDGFRRNDDAAVAVAAVAEGLDAAADGLNDDDADLDEDAALLIASAAEAVENE